MKFSEQWLREWVNYPLSTNELVHQLTMAGLEVDSVTPVAASFNKVVVGEVVSVADHPKAANLSVCQVTVGDVSLLTIVCGARKVEKGMRVPTALVGAQLSNLTIEKTELWGVLSEGMLCSAQELGLAEISEEIMSLPTTAPLGQEVRNYLQLDDVCLEVDLTPNRGDCLSVAGLAREIGVLTCCSVNPPTTPPVPVTVAETFTIEILNPQACPRYVGRVLKNINPQAPTPLWMQERLRRSGLRSLNAVVDITNYVMLEWGQPLHAFDLSRLAGGIRVRLANAGESLTLLDGQTVSLDPATLVIADHHQPVAMAGIMGGLSSGVTDTTRDIFLESAFFAPHLLAGGARRYGLQTEASYRFERGVDPQLQRQAVERATAWLLEIAGGQAGPVLEVSQEMTLPVPPTIKLRASRIQRLLGQTLEVSQVNEILTRLHMNVTPQEDHWQVCPPSFRFDINLEVDLIEELARVSGYDQIPSHPPRSQLTMHPPRTLQAEQLLKLALVYRGYQEAITYSFVNPHLQTLINPAVAAETLANPIASDMSVMRTTLWSGLLPALVYNQKRQQQRVRLFEWGLRFTTKDWQPEKMVAGLVSGSRFPEQWGITTQPVDFYEVKADVEALLRKPATYSFKPATHPALHPGQTAAIYQGDELIGWLGAAHPRILQSLELLPPVYLFELQVAPLIQYYLPKFKEVSKYPSIRRDIAVVVAETVSAAQLVDCVKQNTTDLLIDLFLFDVYRNEKIEQGKKSIAIGLIFQAFSRNLTESEIDPIVGRVVNILEQKLGAQLRK